MKNKPQEFLLTINRRSSRLKFVLFDLETLTPELSGEVTDLRPGDPHFSVADKDGRVNTRYRKSWYWNYIKLDKIGKQNMVNDLDSFKVSSINSYRADSIERYQKGQETELRIKQLERQADSLKALKNQPH